MASNKRFQGTLHKVSGPLNRDVRHERQKMSDKPIIAPPWATGPGEILRHGLELLKSDSDTNRRLAMIAIDNAVELTLKTYLGLPKRITGLEISRKEYDDFSDSFPRLLDATEKHVAIKITGIELGDIEWYHRLRNQLYHQGNGLTVEKQKVSAYAELANLLFERLFGVSLLDPAESASRYFGEFLKDWIRLEATLSAHRFKPGQNILPLDVENDINGFRGIRNKLVHGMFDPEDVLSPEFLSRFRDLIQRIERKQ